MHTHTHTHTHIHTHTYTHTHYFMPYPLTYFGCFQFLVFVINDRGTVVIVTSQLVRSTVMPCCHYIILTSHIICYALFSLYQQFYVCYAVSSLYHTEHTLSWWRKRNWKFVKNKIWPDSLRTCINVRIQVRQDQRHRQDMIKDTGKAWLKTQVRHEYRYR